MMPLPSLLKELCPPAVARALRALPRPRQRQASSYARFEDRFATWGEARARTSGYDADLIFEKTRDATLKVRDGEAVFERDSVLLERPDYPLFLIAGLLHAATSDDRLSILDFGGALGSSYFQCRPFVSVVRDLRWSVVEQPRYVEFGKSALETETLRFHPTIAACLSAEGPNVAVLSGVLQYLEAPYDVIEEITSSGVSFILVDRQPLTSWADEHLSIVRIPAAIYEASYPFWFLSESRFRSAFSRRYDLVAEAEGPPLATHLGVLARRQLLFARRR
jgi:putative methyltransferase (TIGR04325 family)